MASRQIRPIRVEGNIAYVPLTKGYEAIIDASDAEEVGRYNWHVLVNPGKPTYAMRTDHSSETKRTIRMHRTLLPTDPGIEVDHEDGNGLNNRRSNLRPATSSQQNYNQRIRRDNKSGYRGVSWSHQMQKWVCHIQIDGRARHLGYFRCATAAALAYAKIATRLHGEFRRLR